MLLQCSEPMTKSLLHALLLKWKLCKLGGEKLLIIYLGNWIHWWPICCFSPEIRQGSTLSNTVNPEAFVQLTSVQVEELAVSVFLSIAPGAHKAVSISFTKKLKMSGLLFTAQKNVVKFCKKIKSYFWDH